jgi:hypothetical protein
LIPEGPSTLAGKNLSAEAPAAQAARASVGVNTPGMVTMPSDAALVDHLRLDIGAHHQPPPDIIQPVDIFHGTDTVPAPISTLFRVRVLGGQFDRAERVRRVERDLDGREAGFDQAVDNRFGFRGFDAAKDRNKTAFHRGAGNLMHHCAFAGLRWFAKKLRQASIRPRCTATSASMSRICTPHSDSAA